MYSVPAKLFCNYVTVIAFMRKPMASNVCWHGRLQYDAFSC